MPHMRVRSTYAEYKQPNSYYLLNYLLFIQVLFHVRVCCFGLFSSVCDFNIGSAGNFIQQHSACSFLWNYVNL